jgi:hypothetical protein
MGMNIGFSGFSQGFSLTGSARSMDLQGSIFNAHDSLMAMSNTAGNAPVDGDGFVDMNYLKGSYLQEKSLLLQKEDLEFQKKLSENAVERNAKQAQSKEALEKKLSPVWFA